MKGLDSAEVWYRTLIPGTREWNSLAAFLFLSLTFVLPSGYSLGALMLLIGGIVALSRGGLPKISSREKFVIMAFVAYAVFWIGDGFVRGDGVSDADRPLRFLLAVPVILAFKTRPPAMAALVAGLTLGSIGAGAISAYDVYITGASRANGFMPINSFGMLAAFFGMMSLLAYRFISWERQSPIIRACLLIASLAAFYGAIASGSRASWLILIGLAPIYVWLELRHSNLGRLPLIAMLGIVAATVVIALSYGDAVRDRIDKGIADVSAYMEGESATGNIGTRFNMWTGAVRLIDDNILLGWGDYGYQSQMQRLAEENVIEPVGRWDRHLHNQVIHVLVTKGLLGTFIWLLVSVSPIVAVWRPSGTPPDTDPSVAQRRGVVVLSAGVLMALAFLIAGIPRTPFEHHSSVMIFAFGLPLLFAVRYGFVGHKAPMGTAE